MRNTPSADPRVIPPRSRVASCHLVASEVDVFSIVRGGVSHGYGDAARLRSLTATRHRKSRGRGSGLPQLNDLGIASSLPSLPPPTPAPLSPEVFGDPFARSFSAPRGVPSLLLRSVPRLATRSPSPLTRLAMNEMRSRMVVLTLSSRFRLNIVRSSGHLNARAVSPRPRMAPTHSKQKLCPHGSVTGDVPSPSLQKSRRHTTHRRSSASFARTRAAPGEGGTRRSGEARFGVDRDARVGVTFVFDDAARNAPNPVGDAGEGDERSEPRRARGDASFRDPRRAHPGVSSTDVAGVADGVRGTGRGTASLCASLCVFASAHLCGDERADCWVVRDGDGCLALVVPRGEGGAAGEEGLHAPRVSSMGGDVQRRVARAVRFGDVHVAGDEDGAQISAWPRSAARRRATPRKVDRMAGVTSSGASASRRWRRLSPSPDPAAEMIAARYALPLKPPARAMVTREKTAESRTCRHPDSSRSDATHARADDRDDETRDDETTETTKRPRGTLTRALSRDAPGPRPRARSDERHPNPGSAFVPPGARMKILLFVTFMSHRQHRRSVAGAANVSPRLSRRAPTNGRATSPLLSLDSARDVSMF